MQQSRSPTPEPRQVSRIDRGKQPIDERQTDSEMPRFSLVIRLQTPVPEPAYFHVVNGEAAFATEVRRQLGLAVEDMDALNGRDRESLQGLWNKVHDFLPSEHPLVRIFLSTHLYDASSSTGLYGSLDYNISAVYRTIDDFGGLGPPPVDSSVHPKALLQLAWDLHLVSTIGKKFGTQGPFSEKISFGSLLHWYALGHVFHEDCVKSLSLKNSALAQYVKSFHSSNPDLGCSQKGQKWVAPVSSDLNRNGL